MDFLELARFRATGVPRGGLLNFARLRAMSGKSSGGGGSIPTADSLTGVWVFNETLTGVDSHFLYSVKFTSNGTSYTKMRCYATGSDLYYYTSSYKSVYNSGWQSEAYRTVDFGTTGQTVSADFYAWLTANATYQG